MKHLRNLIDKSSQALLAVALIWVGIVLEFNDTYFRWPPEWVWLENDDLIGIVGILTGIGFLCWIIRGRWDPALNATFLVLSIFFWSTVASFEVMHDLAFGDNHGLLAFALETIMLADSFILIFKTKTKRDKGKDW